MIKPKADHTFILDEEERRFVFALVLLYMQRDNTLTLEEAIVRVVDELTEPAAKQQAMGAAPFGRPLRSLTWDEDANGWLVTRSES